MASSSSPTASSPRIQPMKDSHVKRPLLSLIALVAFFASAMIDAATPTRGTIYVGVGFGPHDIYRIEFDYDGADTLTTSAPVYIAHTFGGSYGHVVTPDRHLLVVGQGTMASIS